MRKKIQHIEIVSTTIPGLSSMSNLSRQAILKVLGKHYKNVRITLLNNLSDLESLLERSPDLVLLGMKYLHNSPDSGFGNTKKIWLSDFLSERGIAVTGSQSVAHRLELNKPLAKQCVGYASLKTSDFTIVKMGQTLLPEQIPSPYPLFVKPTNLGGGAGIDANSIVHNYDELQSKLAAISTDLNADALVEKYLPGSEFSVAILKKDSQPGYHAMPIELIPPTNEKGYKILSRQVKSDDAEQVREVVDPVTREALNDLAINAFRSIGGRDYGRIDIRMDENGVPHFLEANLIPSLIDNYGSFPKACAINLGLNHEKVLLRIVELGLMRSSTATESIEQLMPAATPALNRA